MPLRHVPQAAMVPEAFERYAEKRHGAAEVVVQPEHPLDQCRLARAVGAQDGDDLTGPDVQGDPGDNCPVGIPEGRGPQRDDGLRVIAGDVRRSRHEQPPVTNSSGRPAGP